ncbi:hypothetical protein [Actinoallomurus iriomotensis]|uniref:NlpC/P60 domain-containing protein n=1 Tax=Actinoallomurus iriomotensis TaxID=478107 RepID=A0A9W6RG52_9ACTN|nr:hypothetical protein [Actinoallomurus iriomotensis]GLY75138.1 hypothetical protein Airi01_034050 [Actinoallomurus iriomotensis]
MRTQHLAIRVGALALSGAALAVYGLSATPSSPLAGTFPVRTASQETPITPLATISRTQVLANARTWHPHTAMRVPYSQSRTHDGYRTDCSGYASMALELGRPGLNTVGLAGPSVSTRIAMSQLQPGDLVIDATGTADTRHVVIFEKWANTAHTSYWEYEQRGGYGTDYRTRDYGLSSGSQFHAYRPRKLT